VEGGTAASALSWVGHRAAGGVVVVAEFFFAKAGAAATVAVGEDVAALEALWCFGAGFGSGLDGVWHGVPPRVKSVQSLQKKRPEPVLRRSGLLLSRIKCESPADLPGFFYLYFYCSEWSETKMPLLAKIFLESKSVILFCLSLLLFKLGA
jgi:hypothetical protein